MRRRKIKPKGTHSIENTKQTSPTSMNNSLQNTKKSPRRTIKRFFDVSGVSKRPSPPTKKRTNRLARSRNIVAPLMETPIWLSPLKFSPYVSTTVQKLKREFESNVFGSENKTKMSTPATLESLYAMARSQRQREAFQKKFSSKKVNDNNITNMYSELLREHLNLRYFLLSFYSLSLSLSLSFTHTHTHNTYINNTGNSYIPC